MFLKQVLNPDKSCQQAIAKENVYRITQGEQVVSSNTGPYCEARKRLPIELVDELLTEINRQLCQHIPITWKVFGRHLKVFDGSTLSMPDTLANQDLFPQHNHQAQGAGCPIARIVVMMSLMSGCVWDYAIGAFKGKGTGEASLLRQLIHNIEKEAIFLDDRYYPSYFLMAELMARGAMVFFMANHSAITILENDNN